MANKEEVVFNASSPPDMLFDVGTRRQVGSVAVAPEESQFTLKRKHSPTESMSRSVYKRASVVGPPQKLSRSVLGGSFFKKGPAKQNASFSLSASVAQAQVVQKLEQTIEHEVDFLKMFKEGLANDDGELPLDEDDDLDLGDAPMRSTGTGANFLRQLLGKAVYFDIEVGSFIYSHPYLHSDVIFSLKEANPNPHGAEIQDTRCNCCEYEYKSYKDTKLCEFCAKTYCARCRTKRRVFPESPDGQVGDICKVCDRKFFIKEILSENREKILGLEDQLLGENGLASQIERCHKAISKTKQAAAKIKRVFDHDCKKIEYLIDRVKDRENLANEQHQKRTTEVDDLFEKQKQKEAELAKLDEELADLQKQSAELPAQFKYVEDHVVRTEQEYRRLELQKRELDRAQKDLDRLAELESKKRGRAPYQGPSSESGRSQKKSLRGLLNPKRRKPTAGEATLAAFKAGSTPPEGAPQLQTLPDEHFEAPLERRHSESVQTLPTRGDSKSFRRTDILSAAQQDSEEPMMARRSASLGFDTAPLDDEDLEEQPNFAHDASVSTNSQRRRKGKGRKGKPRKPTKGTINKGGARQSSSGACCGTGGDGCSIF